MTDLAAVSAKYGDIFDLDNNGTTSGTSGNDKIVAGNSPGVDYLYGGAGSDTFVFKASSFSQADAGYGIDKVVHDFQGAGGWSATDNDFLHFSGFGAGSTLTQDFSLGNNGIADDHGAAGTQYYYKLHDTLTGNDYTILIKSINDKVLGAGDFNFYGSVPLSA
jgi:hypothetical protein